MRKLILSACVIAASAAYVAKTAMSQEGGFQGLIDRVSFRPANPALLPLDLGDPLAAPAPVSLAGRVGPVANARSTAAAAPADPPLPSLLFEPPADLGPPLPDDTPAAATRLSDVAAAAPVTPPALASRPGVVATPPLPRLRPGQQQVATASAQPPSVPPGPATVAPSVTASIAQSAPAPRAPASKYRDGTFTGSVNDAYFGLVQVRARVTGGKLTGIDVLRYPSDRRTSRSINGYALPILEREVVVAQDAEVHVISGATLTTTAYIRSLRNALSQAE